VADMVGYNQTAGIAAIRCELASVTIPEDAQSDSLEFRACKQALFFSARIRLVRPARELAPGSFV